MKKIKIKIGIIGYLPFEFNRKLIKNWKSDIFEIVDEIEEYHFTNDSDTFSWGYSDRILNQELPQTFDGDLFVGITYVPIENNFYARRLESNRIILSYFEMYQILKQDDFPMENLLLRVLYAYSLVYLRNNRTIPQQNELLGFTHDDTRGCLFDMNGNKSDVIFSLDSPKICDDCTTRIRTEKVSDNCTNQIKKEIKRIKKKKFYKISEFIKRKPLLSLLFSAIFGILISIAASALYDTIKNEMKPKVNTTEKVTHPNMTTKKDKQRQNTSS